MYVEEQNDQTEEVEKRSVWEQGEMIERNSERLTP